MMADPAQIRPQARAAIEFEEADAELALVIWLNLLPGLRGRDKDTPRRAFRRYTFAGAPAPIAKGRFPCLKINFRRRPPPMRNVAN